jgi:YidC/Oxa1 family membrane protein insertase
MTLDIEWRKNLNFFKFIAIPMGYLLSFVYDFVGSYGITIVIFTVIIRLALFPMYASQIKGQMKMQDMQPKTAEIQKKYAHDKTEMNQKVMELYKEEKYNPITGCLPMLIQLPILFGLFALLRNPVSFLPADKTYMIVAVHENFLWIHDLSQSDLWILPILAGITQFLVMHLSTPANKNASGPAANMQGMTKMMKYFFPVMIVWMGRTFPSGMALYWVIGNLCMMAQTLVLKKMRARAKDKWTENKEKEK